VALVIASGGRHGMALLGSEPNVGLEHEHCTFL
jgi:hypothetical protein